MEDDMNAYNILLQRHLNDDRLTGERSSVFLASSSILFLGFAVLPETAWCVLRFIIPVLGLCWSFFAIISNRRTSLGMDFWDEKEKKIEQEGQSFAYMRENEMTPHLVYKAAEGRWLTRPRNRHIFAYILPTLFIILWIISLVWVAAN